MQKNFPSIISKKKKNYKISRKLLMAIINLFIVYKENERLSIYLTEFDFYKNMSFYSKFIRVCLTT